MDPELVGGKAASLSGLASAFPVPPAFCITTEAFRRVLGPLLPRAAAAAEACCEGGDPDEIDRVATEIRDQFLAVTLPHELGDAIDQAFDQLGPPVAARSSANAEDTKTASFAGQYDTQLGVFTSTELRTAVLACWASSFGARAMMYRAIQGVPHEAVLMGVLVQRLIRAEHAGVSFTVHPVTRDPDHMAIEVVSGLGETLVSGDVTPDSYVVRKADRSITSERAGSQRQGLFVVDGQVERRTLASTALGSLDRARVLRVAELCLAVERHRGTPQDVEWAIEGDTLWLLQSRPITNLGQPTGTSSK